MPACSRVGDLSTGHSSWVPTVAAEGSSNVFINGIPAVRVGDAYVVHCSPTDGSECHVPVAAAGSSTVFVNGQQIIRISDPLDCGGASAQGSPTVFAGG